MTTTFRDPTGQIPWPFILLAGGEKSGKSWQGITFSSSPLVGMAYYIEVGEGDADQYGRIPGVKYKIAEHDGSFAGILAAVEDAARMPRVDPDLPNLIILDSGTELWDLLSQEQQEVANRRRKSDEAPITMDQWNTAKKRWRKVLKALRTHEGPVVVTARLEEVTVMDANGKPTTQKEWKIRSEKNLGFEVTGIVKMPTFGEAYLTGVRTTEMKMTPGDVFRLPNDWTLDGLMRQMGLADPANRGARVYVEPNAVAYAEVAGADPALAAQAIADQAAAATDTGTVAALHAKAADADLLGFTVSVEGSSGTLVRALKFLHDRLGMRAGVDAHNAQAQQQPAPAPQAAQQPVQAPQAPPQAPAQPVTPPQPQQAVQAPPAPPAAPAAPSPGPLPLHVFSTPAEGESRADKMRRYAEEELRYQADVHDQPVETYAADLIGQGTLDKVKSSAFQRFLVAQRAEVVESLRAQGRAAEAEAYEAVGIGFPVNLAHALGFEEALAERAVTPA